MTNQPEKTERAGTEVKPAFVYAKSRDWEGYFQAIAGREPRETTLQAIRLMESSPSNPLFAIDLGCGEGRDTAALLQAGWKVHAIDGHPNGLQRLIGRKDLVEPHRLTMQLSSFEKLKLPACDLINASFSLPFCHPNAFTHLWQEIVSSIRVGGLFAGQLFGDRDSWASIADRSHHTRAEVEDLLKPFEVINIREEERKGEDCTGTHKDWHVFHIIAKKNEIS